MNEPLASEQERPGFWARQRAKAREAHREAASRPQVIIYKTAKDFERDAKRRFAKGWTVAAQSQSAGRITATRIATLGVGALFAKKDRGLTVTWMPPELVKR